MTLSRFVRPLAAGLFLAASSAAGALAQDAVTTADLNVRAGPGTQYEIIDSLPEGAAVDTLTCSGSWCRVRGEGVEGWVSAAYLERVGRARVYRPAPPVFVPPPVYGPGYGYRPRPPRWDRPGWDRPGWRPPFRPGRPGWDRPRPPGGDWSPGPRPRPPGGGWDRPRPPGGGGWTPGPRPRPPGGGGWSPGPRPDGGGGMGPRPRPRPPGGGGGQPNTTLPENPGRL